jgi:branched-chain amino acid transport system substrate-binding protein
MLRALIRLCPALIALLLCAAAAEETVKIAYLVPLSGPFANVGETQIRHARFYLDRINARGGVLGGRKLEIVPMDNKNSPQEALLLLPQIADRGIRFVSHCCASHVAVALSEAIERRNSRQPDRAMLLFVEVGDWDVTNDKCSFWTFAFYANGEMMLEALTSVAARQSTFKRAYLINQDYVWGHINRRFTREMLARKRPDIGIVGDDLVPLGKVKDFSPYIAKIRAANADVVFTGNWGPDLVLLIKAAAEARLEAPVYTPAGALWGTATAMGAAAVDKVKAQFRWHPNLDIEEQSRMREEFRQRYSGQEYYAMPSETEFDMLVAAIEKSGTTDPRRVAYALEGLRIQGTMGEVLMRADSHQLVEPLYVVTLTSVNGRDVKYGLEGTNVGTRTEARIEAPELMLATTCRMQRPARP